MEGSYFDESGVGFANQRRDWMKHLDLDKTGTDLNLGGILGRLLSRAAGDNAIR